MIGGLYGGGDGSHTSGRPFAESTGDDLSSCETLTAGGPSDGGSGGNFLLCGKINGLGGIVAESSKTSKAPLRGTGGFGVG